MRPAIVDPHKLARQQQFWWEDFMAGYWNIVADVEQDQGDEPPRVTAIYSEGANGDWVKLPMNGLPKTFLDAVQDCIDLEWENGSEEWWEYRERMQA